MMSYTTEVTRPVPFEAVSTEDIAAADDNVLFSTIQNTTTSRRVAGNVSAQIAYTSSEIRAQHSETGYAKIKIPFPFDLLPDNYEDLKLVNVHVSTRPSYTTTTVSGIGGGSASAHLYLCKDTIRKSASHQLTMNATNSIDIPGESGVYSWTPSEILDDELYLYVTATASATAARPSSGQSIVNVTFEETFARSTSITATWAYYVSPPVINGEPIIITTTI